MTPSKIRPTPHGRDEKADNPAGRIDSHWPQLLGQLVRVSQQRKVTNIVVTIAAAMATKDQSSVDDSRIFDVIPKTVAIAPGPNMSGIASGTKAMLPDAASAPNTLFFPDDEAHRWMRQTAMRMRSTALAALAMDSCH
jgi:hypothetical protein